MYELSTATSAISDKMEKLLREKRSARELQSHKHPDWDDNYQLYRNKVKTNRLTQRQAVNIPLMKETVKTLLSRIDDPPNVNWKELGGDQTKELIYQEIWNDQSKTKKLEWIDVLDKKNVLLYGSSTKFLNIGEVGIDVHVLDVYDVVFDPLMDPLDIETARFIVRQNIFRSLRDILADERYDQEGKDKLKMWLNTEEGIIQSAKNKEEYEKKMERLKAMGVESSEFPHFAGGDVIVNLSEHYTKEWSASKKKFIRKVVVYADDVVELMDETLMELIGVDFWPFVRWSEDPETNDIYPDGVADLVRTPNKILNIWFSQLIENRTIRNFQMHWYDATIEGYQPQTYEPGPGRMLPAPGDPNKTIMPVNVSGLDETFNAIDFVIKIVERGSGATAVEKGVSEKKQITLGEVQMLVGKSMERTIGMAKFYRGSWYELCVKWDALMHANAPKIMKLHKKGKSGKTYSKSVYASDWKSEYGYEPEVSSSSEQEEEQTKGIQKFMFVKSQFPNNRVLARIMQSRMLQIIDVTPEELRQVEEEEKRMQELQEQQMQMMQNQQPGAGQPTGQAPPQGQPVEGQGDPELDQIAQQVAELGNL